MQRFVVKDALCDVATACALGGEVRAGTRIVDTSAPFRKSVATVESGQARLDAATVQWTSGTVH